MLADFLFVRRLLSTLRLRSAHVKDIEFKPHSDTMLPAQDALEAWLMQFMNGQDPQSAALLNLLRSQPKDERRASPMKPGVAPRVHVRVK